MIHNIFHLMIMKRIINVMTVLCLQIINISRQ